MTVGTLCTAIFRKAAEEFFAFYSRVFSFSSISIMQCYALLCFALLLASSEGLNNKLLLHGGILILIYITNIYVLVLNFSPLHATVISTTVWN
jgi:hypothetical protein